MSNAHQKQKFIFKYTGNYQTFTVPNNVTRIKIECFGGGGGCGSFNASAPNGCPGGNGGYSSGEIDVTSGQQLYVYVGGGGLCTTTTLNSFNPGGWNGGGGGGYDAYTGNRVYRRSNAGSGGGATDVRTMAGAWNSNLQSRLIVAGGGGGGGSNQLNTSYTTQGGLWGADGGGLTGDSAFINGGKGGSQSSGGAGGSSGGSNGGPGNLGYGGTGIAHDTNGYPGGGGGGGYYGGGGGSAPGCGGGGGSSYIGGVLNGTTKTSGGSAGGGLLENGKNGLCIISVVSVSDSNYMPTVGDVIGFDYIGNVQTYTIPETIKKVKLECYGAAGGKGNYGTNPTYGGCREGVGGYSSGELLTMGQTLYIYVGGKGTTESSKVTSLIPGGWNGGGYGGYGGPTTIGNNGGGGGGSTDIRTVGGAWNNTTSLNSRIIVAGGGGGGIGNYKSVLYSVNPCTGGGGGGLSGTASNDTGTSPTAQPGTQFGGGAYGGSGLNIGTSGGKGYGGDGGHYSTNVGGGGGGGGYYGGGGGGSGSVPSGAGGSGYVGGVLNGSTIAEGADISYNGFVLMTILEVQPLDTSIIVSNNIPSTMVESHTYNISITVQNTGATTWDSSYGLTAKSGQDVFADIYHPVTGTVAPNQTYTFNFSMTAYSIGSYLTEWQMAHNSTLFGEVLSKNVSVISNSPPSGNIVLDKLVTYTSPILILGTNLTDANGDSISYRIRVNGVVKYDWSTLENGPVTFNKTLDYMDLNVGTNTVNISIKDQYNKQSQYNFSVIRKDMDSFYVSSSECFNYSSNLKAGGEFTSFIQTKSISYLLGYITSSLAKLNLINSNGSSVTIKIAPILSSWSSGTVTLLNLPTIDLLNAKSFSFTYNSGTLTFDIKEVAESLRYVSNYGIAIFSSVDIIELDIFGNSVDTTYLSTELLLPEVIYGNQVIIQWKPLLFEDFTTFDKMILKRSDTADFSTPTTLIEYMNINGISYKDESIAGHSVLYYKLEVYEDGIVLPTTVVQINIPIPQMGYRNILSGNSYILKLVEGIAYDDPKTDYNFYTTPDRIILRPLDLGTVIGGRYSNICSFEVINCHLDKDFEITLEGRLGDGSLATVENGTTGVLPDSEFEDGRTRLEFSFDDINFTPVYPIVFDLNREGKRIIYLRIKPAIFHTTVGNKTFAIKLTGRIKV